MLARATSILMWILSSLALADVPHQPLLNDLSASLQKRFTRFSNVAIEEKGGMERGYTIQLTAEKSAWKMPFIIKNEVLERPTLNGKATLDMTWQIETDTLKLVKHLSTLPQSSITELCPKDSDTPFCAALNREMLLLASASTYDEYLSRSTAKVHEQTAELTDGEIGHLKLAAESGKRVITSTPKMVKMHFHLDLLRDDFIRSAWELQLLELERRTERKETLEGSALAKLFSEQIEKIEAWAFTP